MHKLILLLLISAVSARAEVSRLEALSQIETGNNDRAVGGAGEVSRYQIKPWIWRQYSDSEAYSNRRISTQVAEQHLAGLREIYRKRTRREPTDFDLYVMWNAGPTYYNRIGFTKSRVHPVIRERARRYANLREALDLKVAEAKATVVAAAPVSPKPGDSITLAPAGRDTQSALSPFLPLTQADGSASSIFSILPLASQPEAPSAVQPSGQKPIFALGGISAK